MCTCESKDAYGTKNISCFYDLRGLHALGSNLNTFGSYSYEEFLRSPYQYAEEFFEGCSRIKDPRFLDLCCGTGIHSIFPAKLGYQVVGIDCSPKSIDAANLLAGVNAVAANTSFLCGEIPESLNGQRLFDIVFLSGSLYYFDLPSIVPIIKSHLKPSGYIVCVETYGGNPFLSVMRRLKNMRRHHRDDRTLDSLLRKRDLNLLQGYFDSSKIRYFDTTTLIFGQLLKWLHLPLTKKIFSFLQRLDYIILNILRLRFFAFKFVFIGQKEV